MARISADETSWRAMGLAKRYEDWENAPKRNPNTKPKGKNKCSHEKIVPKQHRKTFSAPFHCAKCRKEFYRLPKAKSTEQKRLAAEWCDHEGHEWVWSKFDNVEHYNVITGIYSREGKPRYVAKGEDIFEIRRIWDREAGDYVPTAVKPWRIPTVYHVCEMCGLERRGKTRRITADDL